MLPLSRDSVAQALGLWQERFADKTTAPSRPTTEINYPLQICFPSELELAEGAHTPLPASSPKSATEYHNQALKVKERTGPKTANYSREFTGIRG